MTLDREDIQEIARAVAYELKRNESDQDDIAHAVKTMTMSELKKFMKEREVA
jgi:hypothetical protein